MGRNCLVTLVALAFYRIQIIGLYLVNLKDTRDIDKLPDGEILESPLPWRQI